MFDADAVALDDYLLPVTTLTFYEGNSSIQCINITIFDDSVLEPTENLCLTARIVGGVDPPFIPKTIITIEDDDGMHRLFKDH